MFIIFDLPYNLRFSSETVDDLQFLLIYAVQFCFTKCKWNGSKAVTTVPFCVTPTIRSEFLCGISTHFEQAFWKWKITTVSPQDASTCRHCPKPFNFKNRYHFEKLTLALLVGKVLKSILEILACWNKIRTLSESLAFQFLTDVGKYPECSQFLRHFSAYVFDVYACLSTNRAI